MVGFALPLNIDRRSSCCNCDVRLAYCITAVIISILLRIALKSEPSMVSIDGQEMKDMSTAGVPMIFDTDTLATSETDTRDTDTIITETTIC